MRRSASPLEECPHQDAPEEVCASESSSGDAVTYPWNSYQESLHSDSHAHVINEAQGDIRVTSRDYPPQGSIIPGLSESEESPPTIAEITQSAGDTLRDMSEEVECGSVQRDESSLAGEGDGSPSLQCALANTEESPEVCAQDTSLPEVCQTPSRALIGQGPLLTHASTVNSQGVQSPPRPAAFHTVPIRVSPVQRLTVPMVCNEATSYATRMYLPVSTSAHDLNSRIVGRSIQNVEGIAPSAFINPNMGAMTPQQVAEPYQGIRAGNGQYVYVPNGIGPTVAVPAAPQMVCFAPTQMYQASSQVQRPLQSVHHQSAQALTPGISPASPYRPGVNCPSIVAPMVAVPTNVNGRMIQMVPPGTIVRPGAWGEPIQLVSENRWMQPVSCRGIQMAREPEANFQKELQVPQTSVIPSYSLGLHQACPNSQSEQVVTPVTLGRQQTSGEGLSIENSAQWPNPGTSIQEDAKTPKDADLLDENIERKGTFQARKYQMDFYRMARRRNIVAFLDTGAGKTFISVLLIKEVAAREKQRQKHCQEDRRVIFFLVPKKVLVGQQAEVIRVHSDLQVAEYCSDGGNYEENWDNHKWATELASHEVFVMTPQILLNMLRHGFITMKRISLICFDECHHARKRHPYNLIMQEFYYRSPHYDLRPKIFGMTASLVDKKSTISCDQGFKELQMNLDSIILTANVGQHASKAIQKAVTYQKSSIAARLSETDSLLSQAKIRLQICNYIHLLKYRKVAERSGTVWHKPEIRRKLPCDHKIKQIGGLRYILQDMGLLAATFGLSEILEEDARTVSETERYSKELQNRGSTVYGNAHGMAQVHDSRARLSMDRPDALWAAIGVPGGMFAVACVIDPSVEGYPSLRESDFRDVEMCKTQSWWNLVEALAIGVLGSSSAAKEFLASFQERPKGYANKSSMARAVSALRGKIDMQSIVKQVPLPIITEAQEDIDTTVTHKSLTLFRFLMNHIVHKGTLPNTWRGMIFVEQTLTAVVLEQMIRVIPDLKQHFRCQSLTGHGGTVLATAMEDKHQRRIVKLFRDGQVNLLVCTSVAEEGLDISDCKLVFRFDLPKTEAAYIQSRGRARQMDSMYIMLVELENQEMKEQVEHLQLAETSMKAYAERLQNALGNKDAEEEEDFISGSQDACDEISLAVNEGALLPFTSGVISNSSGSARVNADAAIALIYRYCGLLPQDQYCSLVPQFVWCTHPSPSGALHYQTKITLPTNSPLTGPIVGPILPSKHQAKAAACLLACQELQKHSELDENLLPSIVSEKEILRANTRQLREEARKAIHTKWMVHNPINPNILAPIPVNTEEERVAKRIQDMDLSSTKQERVGSSTTLYLQIADLVTEKSRQSRNKDSETVVPERIGFLTQTKIPNDMAFTLFPEKLEVDVSISYCGELVVEGNMLRSLKAYHFAVLEGAYFKGKLFASICSTFYQGTLMQDDFFSEVMAGTSFLSSRTQSTREDPIANRSWYLFVPVLSKDFTPFMSTLGERPSPQTQSHRWELEKSSMETETKTGCEEDSLGMGKSVKCTEDYIDWEFLDLIVTRVRNLKRPGIDSNELVKKGDVVMASHNPCVYKVLGVRNDLNMMSDFPAEPSPELAEQKDSHEEIREQIFKDNPDLACSLNSPEVTEDAREYKCFNDYYKDRYEMHNLRPDQPLIECTSMRRVSILKRARNFLRKGWNLYRTAVEDMEESLSELEDHKELVPDPIARKASTTGNHYGMVMHVVPELMVVHPLHWNFWQSLSVFIAISWTFESMLKVAELGDFLCNSRLCAAQVDSSSTMDESVPRSIGSPDVALLFESVTSKQCQEHLNYERLEFIGDALLKYVASLYLYWEHPTAHEGLLTKKRESLVSNLKLAKACVENGLHKYIRHVRLGDHPWRPAGCQFLDNFWVMIGGDPKNGATWYGGRSRKQSEGDRGHQKETVRVKYKTLADVVESLIGAFYVNGGLSAGIAIIYRMGLVPSKFMLSSEKANDRWLSHLMTEDGPPSPIVPEGLSSFFENSKGGPYKNSRDLSVLEKTLNYTIKNSRFFMEALTHCSWQESDPPCYQRLEYLGDAVLDIMVTKYMFTLYGYTNPGVLTNLRQATVNNERLALAAVKHDIQRFILHHSSYLQAHISDFVEQLNRYEPQSGLLGFYGCGERQAPKVLGDVIESLIGATYLDLGGSLEQTWEVWHKLLEPFVSPETVPMHPVRELLEVCQYHGFHVEFERRPNPNGDIQKLTPGKPDKRSRQAKGQPVDDLEATEDEEDQFDLEAEVFDSLDQSEESEVILQLEKSGKRAVSDTIEDPSDPDIYVVVKVDGQVKGEGLGNHLRAARREAARNALDEQMSNYAQRVKEQVAQLSQFGRNGNHTSRWNGGGASRGYGYFPPRGGGRSRGGSSSTQYRGNFSGRRHGGYRKH